MNRQNHRHRSLHNNLPTEAYVLRTCSHKCLVESIQVESRGGSGKATSMYNNSNIIIDPNRRTTCQSKVEIAADFLFLFLSNLAAAAVGGSLNLWFTQLDPWLNHRLWRDFMVWTEAQETV